MGWNEESINMLSERLIGAAIEVHRELGPGLWERSYQRCMRRELELQSIAFVREDPLYIDYKGEELDEGYRLDILVEGIVILELKAVEKIIDLHKAQLLTYLKHKKLWLGLLINFNVPLLKDGIVRVVNGKPPRD